MKTVYKSKLTCYNILDNTYSNWYRCIKKTNECEIYILITNEYQFWFYRRMFPTVRCSFSNLRPDQKYWVLLDIVPCDNKRYRYAYHRSSWLVAGKADPPPPHRLYAHPDAPYSGEQLRKQVVSFEKVKLTNNEMDKNGQVSFTKRRLNHMSWYE